MEKEPQAIAEIMQENNLSPRTAVTQQRNLVETLPIGPSEQVKHKRYIAKLAGASYTYTDYNRPIWNMLFLYFIGSPYFELYGIDSNGQISLEAEHKFSLSKSIALTGAYGVGKTTMFRIIHSWLQTIHVRNPNIYRMSSTEDLIKVLASPTWVDSPLADNLSERAVDGVMLPRPIHILVNEFGYQYNVKNFGTDVNEQIEMFLMKRYDIMKEHRKATHVTMNYDVSDLATRFPERIFDRFKEMFNIIELGGTTYRR